jgi:phosphoenolpyruvate synthase/pyruvate phosphate dikinase
MIRTGKGKQSPPAAARTKAGGNKTTGARGEYGRMPGPARALRKELLSAVTTAIDTRLNAHDWGGATKRA